MIRKNKQISLEQARRIGECLYLDWNQVDLEQFRRGLMGAPVRGREYQGVFQAGRAVMAHMQTIPDYMVRLARLRAEAQVRRGRAGNEKRPQRPTA